MPTVLIRGMLFLSSYFPLTLIFFFLFVVKHPIWEIVTALQSRDGEVMGYIASYLIPFVAIPFGGWQQGVALLIFVIVLGIVYVNSNMIHINPMLNLMGYHLYEIIVEHSERPHALITHQHIALGDTIHIIDIGDGVFLEKGVKMR